MSDYKFIMFTMIYDPTWSEEKLLQVFKTKVSNNVNLYRQKSFLKCFKKAKTFYEVSDAMQALKLPKEGQPMFFLLIPFIISSFIRNKSKVGMAIVLRIVWTTLTDNFYDMPYDDKVYSIDYTVPLEQLETQNFLND